MLSLCMHLREGRHVLYMDEKKIAKIDKDIAGLSGAEDSGAYTELTKKKAALERDKARATPTRKPGSEEAQGNLHFPGTK